jgi:VIT1/CCC1 family predicted Fe2+/Mn2+ transporter
VGDPGAPPGLPGGVGDPGRTRAEEAAEHIGQSRARIARRSRIREMIFGAQDGLLTTLGLVSGVGTATSDRYSVLVAGIAGAVAGMVAMGAGAYISSKSQIEVQRAEVDREASELRRNPDRELEELVQLFQHEGLPEDDARLVAEKISKRPRAMLNAMIQKELGVALEASDPLREGAVMAVAFVLGAVVPIAPWFFVSTRPAAAVGPFLVGPAFLWSVSVTLLSLFTMGVGKSLVARTSAIRGGVEVAGIGLAAATFGYLLGSLFPHLAGAHTGG